MTEPQGPPPEEADLDAHWREEGPAPAGPIPGLSSSGERAHLRAAGTARLDELLGPPPPGLLTPSGPLGTGPLPASLPLPGRVGGTGPLPGSGPLMRRQGTGALVGSGPLRQSKTGFLEAEPEVMVPGVGKMRASDAQRLQALRAELEAAEAEQPAAWKPWKITYLPPTVMMIVGLLAIAYLFLMKLAVEPWWCVIGHGLIAALTGLTWRPFGRHVAWRSFGMALALPGVGAALAWVTYMTERNEKDKLTDTYREFVAFTPTWSAMRSVRDAEAALRAELSVRPWVEDLRAGDLPVKQTAAENLAKNREGVLLLRRALTDADGEVRLFASLALVKAEEQRTEGLAQAREALKAAKVSGVELAPKQLALASALVAYAESGLPAENDLAVLWGEALGLASEVSQWPIGAELQAQALDLMAQVALATGSPEASVHAAKAMGLAGANEARLLRTMEAHFQDGNLEGVCILAKRLAEVAQIGDGADMARYWLRVQEQAQA